MSKSNDHLMLINGELTASVSGQWMDSENPANLEHLGRVPLANKEDVARAFTAAEAAQPGWNAKTPAERAKLLRLVAQKLLERNEEIVQLEVRDTGNTIGKMRGDLAAAAAQLDYYAGLGLEIKGETVPIASEQWHLTMREPYGVVGRIVPFNHPLFFALSAVSGPLMTGNSVLIKTPDQSPLSGSFLGEVCREVLPPGVVNILSGTGPLTGDAMVRHPGIRRIAFTGSVPTGLTIQKAAAETCVKNISLELGGKNPLIIFPDISPEQAANEAIASMNFAWQGQSCGSKSRLFLHESIYDATVALIKDKVAALRIGDPLDPTSQTGPVNSKSQYERVLRYVEAGKQDGARLIHGGKRPAGAQFERGYWVEPTVFADVTMDMRIGKEEVFGPIMSIFKWKSVDEVIAMANAVEYGLTGAIWTNDMKTAINVGRRLQAGYICINLPGSHYMGMPFGGYKNSGVGREECLEELLSYTQIKSYHIGLK